MLDSRYYASNVIFNLNDKSLSSTSTGVEIISDNENIVIMNGSIISSINASGITVGDLSASTSFVEISDIKFISNVNTGLGQASGSALRLQNAYVAHVRNCSVSDGSSGIQPSILVSTSTQIAVVNCAIVDTRSFHALLFDRAFDCLSRAVSISNNVFLLMALRLRNVLISSLINATLSKTR